ncbi:MAG: hypothetical protein QOI74_3539 [Micromonosporaceae bacterium]|jgi:acyl carrier protein|nr:hypothetical protein [Micromonosporaceae bacterium]MDT5037166.1 hypothetical protein [Micromonosporaceae bacterium]
MGASKGDDMSDDVAAAPDAALVGWLTERVAGYAEMAPADIDAHVDLSVYRVDSIYALSLCADIEDQYDIEVDPTVAWDYRTIDAIARHLTARGVAG